VVRSRLSQLDFNYTPPPGFDVRKVKGLVASLLELKPEDHGKSTALEIAAGGKLYNVVVEDERVGKDLLERGGIKKRVTLIPLNKIRAFKLSAEVRLHHSHPPIFIINFKNNSRTYTHRNYKMRTTWHRARYAPRSRSSATRTKSPKRSRSSLTTR
jgi:SMC proteins Flexible Hinge Domain